MKAREYTYGQSALLTPANLMTLFRVAVLPVFLWLIVARGASWWTAGVGFVLAATDYFDGIVARRHGTTRSGAFLDPLADKVVALAAMATLVAVSKMPLIPVALIAAREVWMTWYRSRAGRGGISIPARSLPKLKTLVQDFAIGFYLLPITKHQHDLQLATLWAAVLLTLVTGLQYLIDGRRAVRAVQA